MKGMVCPECGEIESCVVDSRIVKDHIRRRRECDCGYRWTTIEINIPGAAQGTNLQNLYKDFIERESARFMLEKLEQLKQEVIEHMAPCPESTRERSSMNPE